ncbi:MAG: cytochrome c oxidase subunit 3 [Bacteroidota bacterium]
MATATAHNDESTTLWNGGGSPFKVSYGKIMIWYFLINDTFTFASFLLAYGAIRYTNLDIWPKSSEVFSSVPIPFAGIDKLEHLPLVFVSIMTFILIFSSWTMVRAVQEGHQMNKYGVIKWLIPTIMGGLAFLSCQYLEWSHLIEEGMSLTYCPFGKLGNGDPVSFGALFFLITGFHGLHVLFGVILNSWLCYETANGTFQKRGHYEMVEKIGLFWHFVDLVWVYVFLCFYLL